MPAITGLLHDLDERTIAREIGIPHDEARIRYSLHRNTVTNFDEFNRIISDYYNRHFSSVVAQGGSLRTGESSSRAKTLIEREYRRKNGDIVTAYNDAHDGTNGGLRTVLDMLAEGIKAESVENHIRELFDRHISPNSWEDKVEIIRQFIAQYGAALGSAIHSHQPERYAHNYEELIRSYVRTLQQTSSIFRRL